MDIKIGSVVRLKQSTAPEMVVSGVRGNSGGHEELDVIDCQWFNVDDELQNGDFFRVQLVLVDD
jgi:uncharacterized protein YodC (DUF2158 family)